MGHLLVYMFFYILLLEIVKSVLEDFKNVFFITRSSSSTPK